MTDWATGNIPAYCHPAKGDCVFSPPGRLWPRVRCLHVVALIVRAGLCGIGLDARWSQFSGLEERLKGNVAQVWRRG